MFFVVLLLQMCIIFTECAFKQRNSRYRRTAATAINKEMKKLTGEKTPYNISVSARRFRTFF